MGGRAPAHLIAPLQTKRIRVEIDETGDCLAERCDGVGLMSHAQLLANAARVGA
jgi:hypothetical protein